MLFVFTLFIILYGYLKERSSKTLITWNNCIRKSIGNILFIFLFLCVLNIIYIAFYVSTSYSQGFLSDMATR